MIALLQRVSQARVVVASASVGAIERGLLVLLGVERGDAQAQVERLVERVLGYRVFPDAQGKMNLSLRDLAHGEGSMSPAQGGAGLLIVPQFTLAADTNSGTRPSFTPAAAPHDGERLFESFLTRARALHHEVAAGVFGADMQVTLTNDGPVTFWLRVPPA